MVIHLLENNPSNFLTFKLTTINILEHFSVLVAKVMFVGCMEFLGEKPEKFISINGFLTCRLSTHNWLNCTIHNWELDFNAVVLVNRGGIRV